MLSDVLDKIAVRLGIRPRTILDLDGMLVNCTKQEKITKLIQFCVWVSLIIQLLFVIFLPTSTMSNVIAVTVMLLAAEVVRGYVYANQAIRSMVMMVLGTRQIMDSQHTTIENQRLTIMELEERLALYEDG